MYPSMTRRQFTRLLAFVLLMGGSPGAARSVANASRRSSGSTVPRGAPTVRARTRQHAVWSRGARLEPEGFKVEGGRARRSRCLQGEPRVRSSILHLSILLALVLLGVALFLSEASFGESGGIQLQRYGATQLYWFALLIYAGASTLIVASVYLALRIKGRHFTSIAVVLSHVVPIALVLTSIELGVHDAIEDAWKQGSRVIQLQTRRETPARRPEPPTAPLRAPRAKMPAVGPGMVPVPIETLDPGGEQRQAMPKDET